MRSIQITFLSLLFVLGAFTTTSEFEALWKLEGTWRMKTKMGFIYESWKKVSEQELTCASYRVTASDSVLLEKVELVSNAEGIFYVPTVNGQNENKPVRFKLINSSTNKFTFENKLHDYPNRIIYTFITNDSIVARVEGDRGGVLKGSDYYYSRVK